MFDSEDWNVDHVASSLDTSLFGPATPKSHKHKKKNVSESKPKQSALKRKLSGSVTPEPKKKKRKKKRNSTNVSADDNSEVKVFDKNIWKVTVDNENKPQNVKTKKKRKRKAKHDNVNGNIKGDMIEKDSPKKLIKNKSLNEDNLEENHSTNIQSNVKNEKVEHKKKRKRKKKLEKSTEPEPKKTKEDQLEKTSLNKAESGKMSRKERRNKRKKKNSKKNKYKHLALANQEGRAVTEKNVSDLTLTSADAKGDHAEVKDASMSENKSAADPGSPKKKNKKLNRRLSFLDEARSPSVSDSIIDIPKNLSEILTSSMKGKKKRTGEVKHTYSLPDTCSESEAPEAQKTEKVSKKQNFDVTKLRKIMSSEEKKIKDFIQEEVKMSAKKKEVMSGMTLKSPMGKGEKQTSPGKINKKKHTDSAKQKEKMKNEGKQAKTPVKYGFNVTKLKEVMGSEKKTMKALDQDFEKKKKKKEKDGGEKTLKEKMQERLNAARFRYLNEQLYTTTGAEAAELFADDEDAFQVYHQGYESQVSKWPVDPLTVIVRQIKSRHKKPDAVIADMGCGSARLAQRLTGVKVHSFDLVAVNNLVTACNMSEVPLADGSVDVVVFCLSLMGTNLVDFLLEANRVLKNGGTMKIAEVESRFKKVGAFVSKVEKLGFEVITKDLSNKMFYLFDFKKVKTAGKSTLSPKIELDPCVYKKR